MAYKVVATGWGRRGNVSFEHESEALAPLGIAIEHVPVLDEDEYIAAVRDADAIVVGGQTMNARVIGALDKCRILANGGVGVDKVDLDAATAKGIVVTNVPDVFIDEVANHAMMLLLALAKKTVPLDRAVRENRWRESFQYLKPMPRLTGDTIGIVPFGNIPRKVARRAQGFDMKVIAWDPYVSDEVFQQYGVERVADLAELFRRSDFVSAHLPLNEGTRALLDWKYFSVMKPTAYFINTGRGPTHNEADLIRALQEGKIAGAGLDVMEKEPTDPDNPLHKMDNVVLTPHSASISDWANVERRRRVGQEIAAVLQGRRPRNVVNKEVLARLELAEPVTA